MIDLITDIWPVLIGVVSLIVVLAKMHLNIEILTDKVKTLFDLHNKRK